MDPLNLSWYDDDLESRNWSRPFNGSEGKADRPHYNYYAMLLTLLIFIIVFGNVLVCMAVSREKALQTTTNYLIVSLAVADLLVATLVMPWVVYLEVGLGPRLLRRPPQEGLGSSVIPTESAPSPAVSLEPWPRSYKMGRSQLPGTGCLLRAGPGVSVTTASSHCVLAAAYDGEPERQGVG